MNYQVMNQTPVLVKREIEKFLADFPDDHPYQMAMSSPYFRQTFEAKIVSKVLKRRQAISEDSIESCSPQFGIKLLEERIFIEKEIWWLFP